MGQPQSQSLARLNEDYQVVQQLQIGDIVRNIKCQTLHFLRQYIFNSQQSYQNALNTQSFKLSNKSQHLLNFQHFITKSQISFCSSYHKLTLIFQYVDYSLEKQLTTRIKDQKFFTEKQIWSILCSTVLAAVHLINYEGFMHCGLTTKDIRINQDGCVKILSNQMIGIDKRHTYNEGTPKMLAITLIECMTFKRITNQNYDFLQNVAQRLNYSSDMKDMIKLMIRQGQKFAQIQKQLFKLAKDNDSLSHGQYTPSIKSHSRLSSNYRGSSSSGIKRETDKKKIISILDRFEQNQPLNYDYEDQNNILLIDSNEQIQSPDEVLQNFCQEETQNISYSLPIKNINDSYSKASRRHTQFEIYQINSAQPSHRSQRQKRKNSTKSLNLKQCNNKKQKQQKQQITKKEQKLFTDPQFFNLIKSDLENIRIRREKQNSNQRKSRHTTIYQNQVLSQQINKFQSQQTSKSKVSRVSSKNHRKSILIQSNLKSNTISQRQSKQNLIECNHEDIISSAIQNQQNKKQEQKNTFIEALPFKEQNKKQKYNSECCQLGEQIFQYELTETNSVTSKSGSGNSARYYYISNSVQNQCGKYVHVNQQFNRGSYQGTKLNGKRHGFGTFNYSEGGKYVGDWKQNKMSGKGILYYPDHKVAYDGQWYNDQLSGYGILYNEEVIQKKDPLNYEDLTNIHEFWVKYQGYFSQDNKQGLGKLYFVNGQKFQGHFHNDKIDGQGIFFKYDGECIKGKWNQNKLIQIL